VIKSRGMPIQVKDLPPQLHRERRPKLRTSRRGKLTGNLVRSALKVTDGNKSEAARHLGVSRATLYRFLSENQLRI